LGKFTQLRNYQITNHAIRIIHGKYQKTEQGRTQESKTNIAQESENRKAAEAAGVRARLKKTQGEEDGAWRSETIKAGALGS
jgi:hypothetical protein